MTYKKIVALICSRLQRRTLIRYSINCNLALVIFRIHTSMMKFRSTEAMPNKWVWRCIEIPTSQCVKKRPRWEIYKMYSWIKALSLRIMATAINLLPLSICKKTRSNLKKLTNLSLSFQKLRLRQRSPMLKLRKKKNLLQNQFLNQTLKQNLTNTAKSSQIVRIRIINSQRKLHLSSPPRFLKSKKKANHKSLYPIPNPFLQKQMSY